MFTLHVGRFKKSLLRPMLLIGLVIVSVVPVSSWATAQSRSAPLWVVRSLHTSEFGANHPKGLAFSSVANTFLLLEADGNLSFLTMDEELAGTQVLSEAEDAPLNMAFDDRTGSLFVFNHAKSELAEIKADGKSLRAISVPSARFAMESLGMRDPQGVAFDPGTGRLFILDAGKAQIVSVARHPTFGFDADEAIRAHRVQLISLKKLEKDTFRGIAYNPGNGHLYISGPRQKKLFELTQSGDLVSSFDLAALGIDNPSAMTFAPSVDNTDDPGIYDLFILDEGLTGQAAKAISPQQSQTSQIVELSFQAPAALPPGTTLLPATLVQVIDTSNASWDPSSPDPSGVEYWALTNRLLVADSEVEEMPAYWQGKNVYQSTTSGTLGNTCSTMSFTNEPTGLAINPNNNHIFISTDINDRVFEVSLGADGDYCTADDIVTTTNVSSLYNINDAEDVAYGNNTVFIAGGVAAEVYRIPLGANGVLGGGDDGIMTHFDTASNGFSDLEAIGYNSDAGTLFIASTHGSDRYLGELTTTGTLLQAYDLSLMGTAGNIRSDVTYGPGSRNAAVKSLYIASRGLDNDNNPSENDGRIWEISISPPLTATPSPTRTPTPTATPPWTATPITTPPGSAVLLAPSGSISSEKPAYTWNNVAGATWYYLWISRVNGDGTLTTLHNVWYQGSSICSGSTCSFTPAVTLTSGNYRWWIQTWNSYGYGPWSDGMNFSLPAIPPPGGATLISPSGSITNPTPAYTWNAVPAATWYYLWVSKVNEDGTLTTVHNQWYQSSAACSGANCSLTPAVTLTAGNYRWWIQTWNDGGYGPWSGGMNFSVQTIPPPGAATLISPSGPITNPTPTYTWNKVNSSTWYYLWVNNAAGQPVFQQWYIAAQICGSSTCAVMPSMTLPSGSYTWWIQTWNDGGYGPWSNGMNFSLP